MAFSMLKTSVSISFPQVWHPESESVGVRDSPTPTTGDVAPVTTGTVVPAVSETESPTSITISFSGPATGNNIQVLVGAGVTNNFHNSSSPAHSPPHISSGRDDRQATPHAHHTRAQSFGDRYPRHEIPEPFEKLVAEVAGTAYNAAADGVFEETVQRPFPDDAIAGMTLWAPYE